MSKIFSAASILACLFLVPVHGECDSATGTCPAQNVECDSATETCPGQKVEEVNSLLQATVKVAETETKAALKPAQKLEQFKYKMEIMSKQKMLGKSRADALAACKAKCAPEGYCCKRDSGCQWPSCIVGCELAHGSRSPDKCKAKCTTNVIQSSNGAKCSIKVDGEANAGMCGGGNCKCDDASKQKWHNDNCEPQGGCEFGCDQYEYPPPTKEELLEDCKKQCPTEGYCCKRDSGCQWPSCVVGCELAYGSRNPDKCKAKCTTNVVQSSNGAKCSIKVDGKANAGMCGGGNCKCDDGSKQKWHNDNCEPQGGCEAGCDQFKGYPPPTREDLLETCKKQCPTEGYCCKRASGCQWPSCVVGCELAYGSPHAGECKAKCSANVIQSSNGAKCNIQVPGFGNAGMCGANNCKCDGGAEQKWHNDNCEPQGGCEFGCAEFQKAVLALSGGMWVVSAPGSEDSSCAAACSKAGLSCSEESQMAHNGDVDTEEGMNKVLEPLGLKCTHFGCDACGNRNDVPRMMFSPASEGGCIKRMPGLTDTSAHGSFSCTAQHSYYPTQTKLCWCDAPILD